MSATKIIKKCIKFTVWPIVLYCFPKTACRIFYKMIFGRFPDFTHPRSINEKMQVLKTTLYYNDPLITDCVDKLRVKELLAGYFCVENLKYAETYSSFDSVDEFFRHGFDAYPEKFVIKCNHGCGSNILVADKSKLDLPELKKTLTAFFKEDYWKHHVEYQYRFIRKKIFVEEYLEQIDDTYKFYCFHGKVKFLYVSNPDEAGNADVYLDFFDADFNHLPVSLKDHLHSKEKISKPECFEEMVKISERISRDFPFVRVDLYASGKSVYFSELTFLPTGGYMQLVPEGTAEAWGDFLDMQKIGN